MVNIKSPLSVRKKSIPCKNCGKPIGKPRNHRKFCKKACYLKWITKISYRSVNKKRKKMTLSESKKRLEESESETYRLRKIWRVNKFVHRWHRAVI